ncbi:hypothetical protein D3C86_2227290 [compost metagenome]
MKSLLLAPVSSLMSIEVTVAFSSTGALVSKWNWLVSPRPVKALPAMSVMAPWEAVTA